MMGWAYGYKGEEKMQTELEWRNLLENGHLEE
jgi:hypothetical protein